MNIDCRPSDALALAVRAHVPIMVSSEVMDSAGVIPEKGMAEKPTPPARLPPTPSPAPEGPDSEERLSVFEDFLEKLDFDEGPKSAEGDEEPDDDQPDDKKKK